jgi:hypothetical protein
VRVTAKRLDIFIYPFQSCGYVQNSLITGSGIFLPRKITQKQISQESQSVIICYDDYVVLPSQVATILVPGASGTHDEATAMVVKHDGSPTLIRGWRPNI